MASVQYQLQEHVPYLQIRARSREHQRCLQSSQSLLARVFHDDAVDRDLSSTPSVDQTRQLGRQQCLMF